MENWQLLTFSELICMLAELQIHLLVDKMKDEMLQNLTILLLLEQDIRRNHQKQIHLQLEEGV